MRSLAALVDRPLVSPSKRGVAASVRALEELCSRSPVRCGMVLVAALSAAAGLASCGEAPTARAPGIDLGATGIRWAAKNREQKFGFMAAQVHPVMLRVFYEYDKSYAKFGCEDCHGADMEAIDYRMPQNGLYALPKDGAYDDALAFDAEISAFMIAKVTPALQRLYDMGEGPRQEATCFSCHPTAKP
jgi:hypothetical protein